MSVLNAPADARRVAAWRPVRWGIKTRGVGGPVGGVGLAGLSGFFLALFMPRGPVTAGQVLIAMGVGLAVGLAAGFAFRSRWAMLLVPGAHAAGFELGRMGAVGPTVGAIRFDGIFPILAFLSGRGVQAVVELLPMVLGASLGAALARRWLGARTPSRGWLSRSWLYARRIATAAVTAGLFVLAWAVVQPARTPPILGPDGQPLPGSIAVLEPVRLGGQEQWVSIRGRDVRNPVLLHLAGGPGDSDIGDGSPSFRDLEQDFTIVIWDQRGTGKSYPALEPTATYTLDRIVSDTVELTDYLRQRFGQQKIYLLGNSWGSILAVLTAQRAPERYYAVIGSGQMVSVLDTDRLIYQDALAYAERTGDQALAATLHRYGEPPFTDIYGMAVLMGTYDGLAPYDPPADFIQRMQAAGTGFMGTMAPEYSLLEKVNLVRGLLDTAAVLYPQLQGLDFRRDVPRLDVPIYIVAGRYELRGRADLVPGWFEQLEAPRKLLVTFEQSAHAPHAQEAARFRQLLTETVLPETYPTG